MKQKKKNIIRNLALVLLLLRLTVSTCKAQVNYSIHANIVYHLTKYMEWPDNKQETFVIGIIGETPIFEEFQRSTENRVTRNRKIIVKAMSAKDVKYDCQILFISEDESKHLKRIVEITKHQALLIITEQEGLGLRGSCINFNIDDNHLILEINKKNIDAKNIKVASELLTLGKIIQ